MSFTVVFSKGEPRDYGVFDSFEVTDAGVLLIRMQRQDVSRHYIAPGGWLEVVEMAEGQPVRMSRGILGCRNP
jgi:ADP-ribose pyrophosphatase YjhB (NUDIX family)